MRGVYWLFLKLGPTEIANYRLDRARPLKSCMANQNIDIFKDNFIGQTRRKLEGFSPLIKTWTSFYFIWSDPKRVHTCFFQVEVFFRPNFGWIPSIYLFQWFQLLRIGFKTKKCQCHYAGYVELTVLCNQFASYFIE